MEHAGWVAVTVFAVDLLIRVGLSLRVIMLRRPVGVSLAWLIIILAFPLAGALIYLFIGELRLGKLRARRAARIHQPYTEYLRELRGRSQVDWSQIGPDCQPVARLTEAAVGLPAMAGNELTLLDSADAVFESLIRDIDNARRTCHLEFYIWCEGGLADEVAQALERAVARGVICRVLVDSVGSRSFLESDLSARLRQAGVVVHGALPAGLIRMLFVRIDLRLHRKIVVIDGEVAYTGSLNLVDPKFFKQEAGVGQWVDAMVRVRGPAVEGLAITFLEDWELEADEGLEKLRETGDVRALAAVGNSVVQVVPSGPAQGADVIQGVLLTAIYAARSELILTTPYFVPDEALLTALVSAARRGTKVTIVMPARVDSLMVRLASQAHQGDLLAAGVRVLLFDAGLLHTKSVTVDGQFCLFGSLNLDPRSLQLNFEITLVTYDAAFTREVCALQQSYIGQSQPLEMAAWLARSPGQRLLENTARLAGPLL